MTTSTTIFPLMGEPHCKVFHRWLTIWMNYGQQGVWLGNFIMWISGLHISSWSYFSDITQVGKSSDDQVMITWKI